MASSKTIHFGNALYKVPQLAEAKAFYLKVFETKPIDAVCNRFTELGGTVHKIVRNKVPFVEAIAEDPWGNQIGLFSYR